MPDPSFSARSIHFVSQFVVIVQSALQEWSSATAFQKAFEIGDGEAQAVVNLLTKVPPPIVSELKSAVRTRGMRNWISHQMIAKEFSTSGLAQLAIRPSTGGESAWSMEQTMDWNLARRFGAFFGFYH